LVNDSMGHLIGDELIKAAAQRLKACVRPQDTISRFWGDAFAILLEDIKGVTDPIRVADRIQSELCEPFILQGNEVFTSASIGIVLTNGYERAIDVLRDADTALHRAKSEGKARNQLFDIEMHQRSLDALRLEKGLRHALERQEFKLYFQPIYSVKHSKVVAMEALIRWQNPQGRLVLPGEFIPLAEETGLILPIGDWVLKKACSQAKIWRENGYTNLRVSVNISGKQLYEKNLPNIIDQALVENGLRPDTLQLELTESAAMKDYENSITTLKLLSKRGVRISIDNFGTSYSSINYLKRCPVDVLKIDRAFVRDMIDNEDDAALITAMITMGHILKLKVVGEGVETQEEFDFLAMLECDEVQGYLFSHPMPEEEVLPFLRWNKQRQFTDRR
jgi:diguanylate cyclase (GGDEF)-like protein